MVSANILCLNLIVIISVFSEADGYYTYRTIECHFGSWDLTDIDYIRTYNFNKFEYMRYNSTVGKFVGSNQYGRSKAEALNRNTDYLKQLKQDVDKYCRNNSKTEISSILEKTVKPEVHVKIIKEGNGKTPTVLMCSAYDFYPKQIKLTWLKDNEPVTSDVTTEELANGDWYHQIHSQLEYIPKSGEKISCKVEHASFDKPMISGLDPPEPMPESEIIEIAVGASGLGVGIILAASGLIFYMIRTKGQWEKTLLNTKIHQVCRL
ncbi:H-2 class II histocompatibility antigen, E-S beta chain-like [Chanos chanos]|uniref:H-2 class II histocompatibility antigen, E-S beta chain-like n=1 Tax=Chanos chanos TaxID=29144 RepID=A0A6J2UM98_CHACN|nr:H-2 class II histocompatibility antigen, E-S beta chain-like [Chanos chanos]